MAKRKSLEELRRKLASANAAIAAHAFSSDEVTRAYAIIESSEKDKKLVAKRLEEEGLPDMVELGKIQLRNTVSWWKLHRDRNKIAARLDKLENT
ncbi:MULTISPECIES: hypothetical protein [unclassified Rathayibacter]|uniref:hypothetical protein n=1 Tax=unclassified Rathayibacter TaxID=2609250 RepID=UPI000CE9023E|nr:MULTISPECIES: hypothetical protein [unclassified Rathayibacter]PPI41718.1 hypothetical protein C5D50_01755 [Rathayibacter sp. RFBD1]PPI61927.1 hypothetical protein C5D38_03080 [Rathayibacter sp. TRS19]